MKFNSNMRIIKTNIKFGMIVRPTFPKHLVNDGVLVFQNMFGFFANQKIKLNFLIIKIG